MLWPAVSTPRRAALSALRPAPSPMPKVISDHSFDESPAARRARDRARALVVAPGLDLRQLQHAPDQRLVRRARELEQPRTDPGLDLQRARGRARILAGRREAPREVLR